MNAPIITIFVRHAADCKYKRDEFCRRCQCRKHLRWTLNGKQYRRQAGTRSWAEAEQAKRAVEDQLSGKPVEAAPDAPRLIEEAVRLFNQDKAVQGVTPGVRARYKGELQSFQTYCESAGVITIQGVTRELLTGFVATWETRYSSQTQYSARARLGSFLRYCFESQWIARIPSMPRIVIDAAPTMPLSAGEFTALMATANDARLRAVLLLMRYSGLAIRDAVCLERGSLFQGANGLWRVVTSRQKTGTHVSVPLPAAVSAAILATANTEPKFLFWDGRQAPNQFAAHWSDKVSRTFAAAGIADVCFMKSHRIRDTFAVDLLEKGIPMEEVSKLLGHESIRTTEKHYAKWVKGRQDRLDALVTGTWAA
jgi:integrase